MARPTKEQITPKKHLQKVEEKKSCTLNEHPSAHELRIDLNWVE